MNEMTFWMAGVLALDLLIAVAVIFGFRALQGVFAGVNVKEELDSKDNLAFGLSIAGGVTALCLVLSAAVGGEAAVTLTEEALNVLAYGIGGVVLLKAGMIINDRILLNSFSVSEQLRAQNVAVGTVQAANLVAVGILIHSAVNWIDVENWTGLGAVASVYLAGQVVLLGVTRIRTQVYKTRHDGASWQAAIADGNTALAIRYAGQILGTAIAVSAVAGIVSYLPADILTSVMTWFAFALAAMVVLWVLYRICLPAILPGVDIVEEVDNQKNSGVAFIEASIFIGLATIIKVLLA